MAKQVTIQLKSGIPTFEEGMATNYLQQIASVAETETLRILAELSVRPGANKKVQSKEKMIKTLM